MINSMPAIRGVGGPIASALRLQDGEWLNILDASYSELAEQTVEWWQKSPTDAGGGFRGIYTSISASATNWGFFGWRGDISGLLTLNYWLSPRGLVALSQTQRPETETLDNEWHHVAWRIQATRADLLVDGVVIISAGGQTNTVNTSDTVALGAEPTSASASTRPMAISGREPCFLAEVRHWDIVRTNEEIQDNFEKQLNGDEAGLVAYWPLQKDFSQKVSGGPLGWTIQEGTPFIESGAGPRP